MNLLSTHAHSIPPGTRAIATLPTTRAAALPAAHASFAHCSARLSDRPYYSLRLRGGEVLS